MGRAAVVIVGNYAMGSSCFWLDGMGNGQFRVLSAHEVSVFRGTLLNDPATGEPIVLHGENLTASFDSEQLHAIYTFSDELCERLDEAAELHLRDDGNIESEDDGVQPSDDEEEITANPDPSPVQGARDARAAQRAEATAVRNEAAELRQRSLQEVLVQRTADRPDRAPADRPRRTAATQGMETVRNAMAAYRRSSL